MILEIALASAVVVAASAIARAVVTERARRDAVVSKRASVAAAIEARRGLRVGDVLLHVGDELWLAGAIELDEEGSSIVLFRTPENTRAAWVAQLDEDARELALLAESTDIPEGRVPDRLPVGGRVLSLQRRGRARVTTRGEHVPEAAASAGFTILADAGGRTAIIVDFDGTTARIALVGDRVERALIDVLPGGDPPA